LRLYPPGRQGFEGHPIFFRGLRPWGKWKTKDHLPIPSRDVIGVDPAMVASDAVKRAERRAERRDVGAMEAPAITA
jgi:hypothetical protein